MLSIYICIWKYLAIPAIHLMWLLRGFFLGGGGFWERRGNFFLDMAFELVLTWRERTTQIVRFAVSPISRGISIHKHHVCFLKYVEGIDPLTPYSLPRNHMRKKIYEYTNTQCSLGFPLYNEIRKEEIGGRKSIINSAYPDLTGHRCAPSSPSPNGRTVLPHPQFALLCTTSLHPAHP